MPLTFRFMSILFLSNPASTYGDVVRSIQRTKLNQLCYRMCHSPIRVHANNERTFTLYTLFTRKWRCDGKQNKTDVALVWRVILHRNRQAERKSTTRVTARNRFPADYFYSNYYNHYDILPWSEMPSFGPLYTTNTVQFARSIIGHELIALTQYPHTHRSVCVAVIISRHRRQTTIHSSSAALCVWAVLCIQQ